MFVIQAINCDDTCPYGMRKTYLDETTASDEGSARNYVPALNFYEGNGALWYRKKVLIEPRFEVHFKANLKAVDVIENSKEQYLEGFTIVISKFKNKISTAANENMGYSGLTKSYVAEFDFNKNIHDPDDSSYSFRYCDNDCSYDDGNALNSGKLSNQRFNPSKDMNWDFRLIYVDKRLSLYSGPNEVLFTRNVDLYEVLGSNTAYVGFTGYMYGNRRELNVLGTFICEDNYDISKMSGKFFVDGNEYETYTYKAGESVQYLFSFVNNKNQVIPHCFKQGIWTYSFSLSLDCSATNLQIRMIDEYNLLLSMNACNVLGDHKIGISEASHGVGPERTYTIIGGNVNKMTLIGHDGTLANANTFSKLENGVRTLTYGSAEGDFPLKGTSYNIVLDFDIKDAFGNNAEIGSTSSDMLSATGFSLSKSNSATLAMKKVNDHYQLIITVSKTGTYEITKNSYMSESIKFNVIIGGVSSDDSYCTLEGYTEPPVLKVGDKVNYNCYFKDGKGNIMSIATFLNLNEYDFVCQTEKTAPTKKTTTNKYNNKNNYYECPYEVTESGFFQFNGYLVPKGKSTKITITPKINQISVMSSEFSLNYGNVENMYSKKWVSIENKPVIEYENDNSGRLTALDLADTSGTLMSYFGKYPESFDASKVKVEVYNEHDRTFSFGDFYCKKFKVGNIEYIGVYNSKNVPSDQVIKRSSFDYTLKFTYNNVVKYVYLRFNPNTLKIGSYTTCFHPLDISKTTTNIPDSVEFGVGQEKKLGTLELRTNDKYLYNYDIGKDQITLELEKGNEKLSYRIVPLSIAGTYEIYATIKDTNWSNMKLKVKGQEIKTFWTSTGTSLACYLVFQHPEYFTLASEPEPREHYYDYSGDYIDGNLHFSFFILDRYYNNMTAELYQDNFADIYSLQYGQDYSKYFTCLYNKSLEAYEFRDKLNFQSKKYTWVFFMRDGNCNHKYYITYDQGRVQSSFSLLHSYYTLLQNEININEYSYVDVFLKDGNNNFMGVTSGKLEELKQYVTVTAKDPDTNKEFTYELDQITSSYSIRFKHKCDVGGTFKVIAHYKEHDLPVKGSDVLKVLVPKFSLKNSKLQMILDTIIDMNPNTKATIKNNVQVPLYNLILYTEDGKLTTYSPSSTFSAVMTGNGVNMDLDVTKNGDYIQFSHKDKDVETFQHLKGGDYTLTVTADGESVDYPLYLVGDGDNDYSNDKDFDLSKTEVVPTHIDGFAGVTYDVLVTFKAKDGLRWNYWADKDKFSISNSYGLDDKDFVTEIVEGYKKGQYIIHVTQNKITDKGDNIMTISYGGQKIPQTVSLNIKAGEFAGLVLVDGPTDGNVINHPILTFKPVDAYGNFCPFDSSATKEYLNSLTNGRSLDGVPLTTNNYLDENGLLKVQYKTTISTNVQVTSDYLKDPINYRIKSGPIDPETSWAEMQSSDGKPGSDYTIMIYPKDLYNNDIDDLSEDDMKKFHTYYDMVETGDKTDVTNCKLVEGRSSDIDIIVRKLVEDDTVYDSIQCTTPISYIGNIEFHVDYVDDEIECRNCVFSIFSSQFDFKNTKTYYKNREYYLVTDDLNEVEAKKEPVFELTFYDQFKNLITDPATVEKLDIVTTFEGADVKLCVNNNGYKKVAILCPSTNGDDNINKWQYVTNGDKYKLIVSENGVPENVIEYPIKIVGGSDGSSDPVDLSKTNFNPTTIEVDAGEEGQTIMELRTADGTRKNYWYPDINDKIKVDFAEDKDTCSYTVDKGELPGQYAIKVTCTKANPDNSFTVTVDGKKIDQKIKVIVNPGPVWYLEVEEPDKFNAVGDKYTWKVNPSNDDDINFLFKLQDKYRNYITRNVIGTDEIEITSDTFGSPANYYDLQFNEPKIDYLFTDKIYQPIEKHTWNIECTASGKKYSFIYTRVPGKVDVDKSYWEIDKTEYIIYETSTVWVTLLDRYGVNVGTVAGRLLKEKDLVKVVTNKDKDILYDFNTVTTDNKLQYNHEYKATGTYQVSATYDGKQIRDKKEVHVNYQKIDLKNSKLYYDIGDGKENPMSTSVQTNIDNKKVCPTYKLYLYTEKGEKITLYDKKINTTSLFTLNDVNSWEMDVSNKDDYILISHKDCETFKKLPQSLYNLQVTVDGEPATYPVYLMGDKDVSPYQKYDITKTYVNPTYIDGEAGEKYQIDIEFRGQDGLRWNYEAVAEHLTVKNSYGLDDSKLKLEVVKGDKNGQLKLFVTQYVTTTEGKDNILYLTYENKDIPQTVALHIKCHHDLFELVYDSGAVDGTVVNPSIVKFIPKDKYGNLYTDLFNATKYPKKELEKLTDGKSHKGYEVTPNSWVDGQFLNVQYGCKNVTKIILTSPYNPNTYEYWLWSGPVDPDKSYAEVEKTDGVKAGDNNKLIVHPRDTYGNPVTNITEDELAKFDVDYTIDDDYKKDITDTCDTSKLEENFDCQTVITKAGDAEFFVDYDDKPVKCINCEFPISPGPLDFNKTKTYNKNENKEMSKTELNVLPVSVNPNFELHFFDKYENPITDKKEVENLKLTTDFEVTDVKLCVKDDEKDPTKLSNLCKSDNGDNERKWGFLPNGDKYKLIVTNTETNEKLTYPVQLTGGYNDGSPEPINPDKTYFEPPEKTLVAGEVGTIFMELRTDDDKRKNFWYPDPEKSIAVKFPDDVDDCSYSLAEAEKPGQYNIKFNCTKTHDPFPVKVEIENTEVPKPLELTVVPGKPFKSRLFRMNGEEILEPYLGTVSVEDKFQMINRLYDQYDNLITNLDFDLNTLQIKMAPVNTTKSHTWGVDLSPQTNGDIILTLRSTFAAEHVVVGAYFPLDKYTIIFTPGKANAENSLLEVSHTERWVGEELEIYITPYDKYNNLIDASIYKDESPFQVKYSNDREKNQVIKTKHEIKEFKGNKVISYPAAFYVTGITTVSGYIDTDPVKCVSCRVNVKAKDIDFLNYNVLRLDHTKNDFETLKNGTVENNQKEEPMYRLYPKDKYGNAIDTIPDLKNYKAYLKSQNESTVYNLKINNKDLLNQPYAEFVINDVEGQDVTYKSLVGGYYDLVFTDGDKKLVYNITLSGDGHGGSNEPVDPLNTQIIDQNLKYVAGKTGYIMIELRTSDNVRKNFWDGYNFKVEGCDENDKTFNYTQKRAGTMGVFYLTVTTEKANTYPSLVKCPLKIYLNDQLLTHLNPEQEVSPDEVVRTEILKEYWKEPTSSKVLKDGTADDNYVFEVASYDKYGNLAETLQEVVGIKVNYQGGDEIPTTSATNTTTGYRKYVLQPRKAGKYIVSTDKTGPQGLYLPNESEFTIHPGVIDLSKLKVEPRVTPIKAGSKPAIIIEAFDKYDNPLYLKDYVDKFNATFIDPKNKKHSSKGAIDSLLDKVVYTSDTPVTVVGDVKVDLIYNDKDKVDTSHVIIKVIAGDPDPTKSILTREVSKGVFVQYKNGDSFTVDVNEPLILNITLYDKYNNFISEIPDDAKVLNPLLSGNSMSEIKFTVNKYTSYFGLDFNENNDYIKTYQHLVKGTYDLTYDVKTDLAEAPFKYYVIVATGDDNHGNGPYDLDQCILKPKNVSFVAGNYEQFTLELRTKEGKLYNDDIDLENDILVQSLNDPTFKYEVKKAGSENGIYTITIYSEKKGDYTMNVLLTDPKSKTKEKKEVGPGYYTVYPDKVPYKVYTTFPLLPNETVPYDQPFVIEFTLADKFNNTFEGRHDIVDDDLLTLLNKNEPLPYADLELLPDETTYKMTINPKYPPNPMELNVLYNDKENQAICFPEDIIVNVLPEIDYNQTVIVSKNKDLIHVGEILDMWLYTFDKTGECIDDKDYSRDFKVEVTGPLNDARSFVKTYDVVRTDKTTEYGCKNEYKIVTTDADIYTMSGDYLIKVFGGDGQIAQYNQVCLPLDYSKFYLEKRYDFDYDHIPVSDTPQFRITGTDKYGNKVGNPLIDDITIKYTKDGVEFDPSNYEEETYEGTPGVLDYDLTNHHEGTYQMHMYYKGEEIKTVNDGESLPKLTFEAGPCRAENNEHMKDSLSKIDLVVTYKRVSFTFQCYDVYNNTITKGGEDFTVSGNVIMDAGSVDLSTVEIEDNGDGTYTVSFIPDFPAEYIIRLSNDGGKYGDDISLTFTKKTCSGATPILCSTNVCAKDYLSCIDPANGCDINAPFKCKVNGTEMCVKSQIDCDCPEGYIRCDYMRYCVPETRPDMCPTYNYRTCSKISKSFIFFDDGICRDKSLRNPSQRVCPLGKVLCCDLSCADNYDLCPVTEELPGIKTRCVEQTITKYAYECPSTIMCTNPDYVVCPDGSCVANEIMCGPLRDCPLDYPYLCGNNACAKTYKDCSKPVACGDGKALCQDNICRDTCQ